VGMITGVLGVICRKSFTETNVMHMTAGLPYRPITMKVSSQLNGEPFDRGLWRQDVTPLN
jgi:hypothetical protein